MYFYKHECILMAFEVSSTACNNRECRTVAPRLQKHTTSGTSDHVRWFTVCSGSFLQVSAPCRVPEYLLHHSSPAVVINRKTNLFGNTSYNNRSIRKHDGISRYSLGEGFAEKLRQCAPSIRIQTDVGPWWHSTIRIRSSFVPDSGCGRTLSQMHRLCIFQQKDNECRLFKVTFIAFS